MGPEPPWGLADVRRALAGSGPGDRGVAAIAARQHGLVTTDQLLYVGLERGAVAHRVRTGRLYRVHVGVYLVGRSDTTDLARLAAAVLACGPDSLVSHYPAGWLWGMVPFPRGRLDVSVIREHGKSRPGIRVHRAAAMDTCDRRIRMGVPVTAPARTLLDLAEMIGERFTWDHLQQPEVVLARLAATIALRR